MNHDIEAIKLHKRLNLYVVKTKKFKTDLIGIYIKRHLTRHEASLNALLTRLLMRGTSKYPSSKALNIKLEASYGMILVSDVVKYGEYHILQFKLQFPNGKHIIGDQVFDDAVDILKEVIFNPLKVDGLFNQEYFEQEKENLIDEIHSRVNDKMSYSLERCIECMFDNKPYSEYVYGHEERIRSITLEELTRHYDALIEDSQIDICVMGDVETQDVKHHVEALGIREGTYQNAFSMCEHAHVQDVRYFEEVFKVKQSKLVMGYRTHVCQTDPLYEASVLAYHILGGGASSKLFAKLREEMGLCYYVYAKSDRFTGCMFIGAGIEAEHYASVQAEVSNELERLRKGEVSIKDLQMAIEAMVSSIQSLSDFPNSFINFYYTEVLGKPLEDADIYEMIEKYQGVTLEDLVKVYKKLELDTVYLLKGAEDEIL